MQVEDNTNKPLKRMPVTTIEMNRNQLIQWLNTCTDDVTTVFRVHITKKYAVIGIDQMNLKT